MKKGGRPTSNLVCPERFAQTMNRLPRRAFLKSSALMAACGAASFVVPERMAANTGSFPFRLGLASYTLRNFPRAEMIRMMKSLRISDLNAKDVKDHLPADPKEEANALQDYAAAGIKLHAAGTISLESNDAAVLRSKFEYCRRAGVGVMVAGDPTPQNLPAIEALVKEFDLRVAIHNHGPEDKLWHAPSDILHAVRNMDQRIGCCIDVGHTERAGEDPVKAIHAAGPRLFNLHMKDLTSFDSKESQVPVGQGKMPVKEIFKALQQLNYSGFVDLEYEVHPDNPLPGVKSSFDSMRSLLV